MIISEDKFSKKFKMEDIMELLQMNVNNLDSIDQERVERLRSFMANRKASLCSERALIYTDSFKQTEKDSYILRKAKAFAKTLEEMTIYVQDDSLIFGNQASKNFAAPVFPEYSIDWIVNEIDTFEKRDGDVFYVDESVKNDIKSIQSYWHGRTHEDKVKATIPETNLLAEKQDVLHRGGISNSGDGHIVSDHKWLLDIGYDGMIDLINEKLLDGNLSEEQKDFYQASRICLEAGLKYADRFEKLLEEKSNEEKNSIRKNELEKMSKIAKKVLRGKAESFHEALEAIYLNHVFQMIESNGHSFCYGRFDQYAFEYYKKDIESGVLSQAKALELIIHFFLMNNSLNKIRTNGHTTFSQGYPLYTNLVVGGLLSDGSDGTNDLTYLSVEAMNQCRMNEPNFSMRYHKDSPKEILMLASRLIATGFGMPSMFNDDVVVKSMVELGIKKKDALNYCPIGCVETGVEGMYGHRATGMTYINWGKMLEIILYRGTDPKTGIKLLDFFSEEPRTYEELWDDWKLALDFYSKLAFQSDRVCDKSLEIYDASPLGSIFIHNALEKGKTLKEGGCKYDVISQSNIGSSVVGNSLYSIKKNVYEDRNFTYAQLLKAMKANWEGEENQKIKKLCLEADKFGNDLYEVDQVVADVFDSYLDIIKDEKTVRTGRGPEVSKYTMSTSNITSYIPNGKSVGATPDGRVASSPLNEGCSPTQGTISQGPTALINSVSKLPNDKVAAGQLLNTRFAPDTLKGEENLEKFVGFLRASAEKEIFHNQFNVVKTETLRKAQKNPDQYRDLIIRVSGYCAQFISLTPEAQEAIIARNELDF